MATIRGFRGLRFKGGDLNTLVCPPYDIISEEQRKEFINKNPHNIVRLELPSGGENRYKEAGETLKKWMDEGILEKDLKDGIYVYEMEFCAGGVKKSVKGFVCLVKLEEFSKGIILPHEETLSKAKTDRFNLMSETFCNFSQIYSLYMDENSGAYSLVDSCSFGKPDMEVVDGDGTIHRMWCVFDENVISKLSKIFEQKKLYIADGHHRYETALNFHKHLCEKGISNELSGYVCMMLVNMENEGLEVFPTHRIVKGLADFNPQKLIKACEEYFDIINENGVQNIESHLREFYQKGEKAFAFYTGGNDYSLLVLKDKNAVKKMLPSMSEAYCNLDVSILHTLVLEKLLGIDKENMANQKNLIYTRNFDEAISAAENDDINCVFILNPTRVSEIKDVALAGEKMPQKSTYFYPKLITGLVMNKF
ncbi:MAG: DUF1015 domain-containing protein [Oscillospiraceae bacterium]|nr:DUF1015 domain-containing protein [Oscillospiraceae bacterium]